MSNLDRVLYPETGTTKADVIGYYTAIAPALIPYSRDRPLTRKRWPNGVGTDAHPWLAQAAALELHVRQWRFEVDGE